MCWGDTTPYLHKKLPKPEALTSSVDCGTIHYSRDSDTLLTRQRECGDSDSLIDSVARL